MEKEDRCSLRRLLKIIGTLCALGSLLWTAGCKDANETGGDPVRAADAFFALLEKGKIEDAYESAAFGFQASQNLTNFRATVVDLGIANVRSITWTRKSADEKEARLNGEIVTSPGRTVLVSVTMVKEARAWRLHALRTSNANNPHRKENHFSLVGKGGEFRIAAEASLPAEAEIVALVRESLTAFNAALQKRSFTDFNAYISKAWQDQTSERRMERIFGPLMEANVNLADNLRHEPVMMEPPRINSEGLLLVKGSLSGKPQSIVFQLSYIYELPKWKLFGLDLGVRKPETP